MTTLTSFSQNKITIPAPPDQPSPQSPPSSFMSSGHAPTNAMTTGKFSSNNQYHGNQSLPNVPTPPSSLGRPVVQPVSTASSLLTPSSTGANSAHEDMEIDSLAEDSFGDSNPSKRRRTYGSFDAERRSSPASIRYAGDPTTDDRLAASPSMQQIQGLITNSDCSPYYLVCQKKYEKSYPDPSDNLIQLYGLQPIADKVARFDATGKKNKLRKSYKGHIATLSGKNEVVAKPTQLGQYYDQSTLDPAENKLQMLAFYPDEEWRLQNVLGKEMSRGFDMAKLRRGLANITKGDIPRFDPAVLGLDDEPRKRIDPVRSPQLAVGTPQLNGAAAATTPGNASTVSAAVTGELGRPDRKNRKRSYHDDSFEGYEEDDESGGTTGNGPGGGSGSGAAVGGGNWPGDPNKQKKKKRKKNPDVDSPGGMDLGRHSVPIYGR